MRRIDDYMDALCANNQNNREVKMLYNRELDYSKWREGVGRKHISFTHAVSSLIAGNEDEVLQTLTTFQRRLKKVLGEYESSIIFNIRYRYRENKYKFWEQHYHLFRREQVTRTITYIDGVLKEQEAKREASKRCSTDYYHTQFSDEKLTRVYDYLMEQGYLQADNTLQEFVYYFSGRGEKPTKKLTWCGEFPMVKLSHFLHVIAGCDGEKWKKAKMVFTTATNLAAALNNSSQNKFENYDWLEEKIRYLLQ